MPTRIFEIGRKRLSISIVTEKPRYSRKEILKQNPEEKFTILKQETENRKANEIRYSYMVDGKETIFIRGHCKSPKKFHVDRIENITKAKHSERHILTLFSEVEQDLKKHNITHLSTFAIPKLAHILVRRYGFKGTKGKDYEYLKNQRKTKIPLKAFLLEKEL